MRCRAIWPKATRSLLFLATVSREEMLSLAGLVHGHAGHRFTFALVELAVYQVSANARVIIPSVLAQTVLIDVAWFGLKAMP